LPVLLQQLAALQQIAEPQQLAALQRMQKPCLAA
jgi:hypothetical protein